MHIDKNLGQHFLIDPKILKKIVKAVKLEHQNILEIGGGTGNLSKYIKEENPKSFSIIEIDEFHCRKLQQEGFNVINADCLKTNIDSDIIISNLPYNLSTKFLHKLFMETNYNMAILMLQYEFIEKLIDKKNALSILAFTFAEIEFLFKVNPKCFFPVPKVESAVIKIKNSTTSEWN